jgi:hypothetical protein
VVELGLDGAWRPTQGRGDLHDAVVLVVVQRDHLGLAGWQGPDRLPDLRVVVGELDGVVLVPHGRVPLPGLLAEVGAQERAPLVEGDLADPGARVVEGADPVPVPVGDQEGLLGELLGHDPATQQALEQPDDPGVLADVELVERFGGAGRLVPVAGCLSHVDVLLALAARPVSASPVADGVALGVRLA